MKTQKVFKTSHRWEFSTPHPELIPHVDGQSF